MIVMMPLISKKVRTLEDKHIIKACVGQAFFLFLDAAGIVYSSEANSYGQLGLDYTK